MADIKPNFRLMNTKDLQEVLSWAAAEGWNPGMEDCRAFITADPEGFFVAEVAGRTVAAICVVNHDARQSFLGLYLCLAEFRGHGLAFALWQHALEHAGNRCVGLDGVAAQEANYQKSGFQRHGATTRYSGALTGKSDPAIRPLEVDDHVAVTALDREANGYERVGFLGAWLTETDTRKSVVLQGREAIEGFATIRLCHQGVKIGPVIAPDAASALCLCRAAVALMPADRIQIDLPSSQGAFASRLRSEGFEAGFVTARMYRGTPPETAQTLCAIATMELG